MQEHAINISSTSNSSAVQSIVQILSYNEIPVKWCSILLEVCFSSSNKSFFNQFCSITRDASLLTVVPSKKKAPNTHFIDMTQNMFTLGESHICSSIK